MAALLPGLKITGYMVQMGVHEIDRSRFDLGQISKNPFWCPDAEMAETWATYLDDLRKAGSSIGAVVEVTASGVPAGLGAPIYAKLDTDIAAAMMSINAVKGVEMGAGMGAARLSGEENADEMTMGPNGPEFSANNAGGILGGISSGQDVVCRFAVKPTSSILTPRAGGRSDDGLHAFGPCFAASRPDGRKSGPNWVSPCLPPPLCAARC